MIGVAEVEARRYAVATQAMCSSPPRRPAIVGSAVATMVVSSDERSRPTINPPSTVRT